METCPDTEKCGQIDPKISKVTFGDIFVLIECVFSTVLI